MTRKISALALLLVGGAAFAVCDDRAVAQPLPNGAPTIQLIPQAGGWTATPRFDSNGKLAGCAAFRPADADGVQFFIMALPNFTWGVALNLPSRELELDKPIPADITFDGRSQYHVFGHPIGKHQFMIVMQSGAVTEQFRRAASLSIFFQGQYFSFSLAGTSRLLPALMNCTRTNGTLTRASDTEMLATSPHTFYYGDENADYKVPPQDTLKDDVGASTPLSVPGVITLNTTRLMDAMLNGRPMVLIDALQADHAETIKGAVSLPYAGDYGTFNDQIQTRLADALNGLLQGRAGVPLIFFCQGVRCWESYNAALRARAAGFPNIYWYRGGLNAWKQAGFPLQPNSTTAMPAKSADALPDAMPANPPGVAPVATVTMPADSAPVLPQSRGTGTPATPPAAVPLTTSTNAPDAALVTTRSTLYYGNENVDFKVRPQNQLKYDVGTRTPRTIPGASTVTTAELMEAMQHGQPMVLIDALQDGHSETIKGAVSLPYAGAYGDGTFHDQVQAQLTKALNGLVQGRERVPLVFFCQGVRCWESYNAALRARAAGFQNISWYRGGLNAWKQAGLPLQPRD